MESLIVIPARLASTRLPRKLLRVAGGKSILQHTHDAAVQSKLASEVVVAVDDARLAAEVEAFGGRWMMTPADCPSGTDRIAHVATRMPHVELFINVQGDEPEIDPETIDAVGQRLLDDPSADMATAAAPLRRLGRLEDPDCVKVIVGGDGRAIYFSRSPVPHVRDGSIQRHLDAEPPLFWHHVGLYAYRPDFLRWFAAAPPSRLEQAEKLEQLRAVEAGKRISIAPVNAAVPGIDTQQDLDAFVNRLTKAA